MTYFNNPGTEVPVNVQTIGLELNWDITSCTLMKAVWNSIGEKVTVTSVSPLAGIIPNNRIIWHRYFNNSIDTCTEEHSHGEFLGPDFFFIIIIISAITIK